MFPGNIVVVYTTATILVLLSISFFLIFYSRKKNTSLKTCCCLKPSKDYDTNKELCSHVFVKLLKLDLMYKEISVSLNSKVQRRETWPQIYDVFISYSQSEASWVETELWQELECPSSPSCPSYTCCVHTRDFLPGLPIMDQILTSIKASRGTIIVMSKSYCRQPWTRLEWREALLQAAEDRTKVSAQPHFPYS